MAINNQSLSALLLCQLVVGCFSALAGWICGSLQLATSIAVGAGLMLFNVLLLGWMWQRLMRKKSIAWTSLVIVIKYAVLLGSIYYLTQTDWFRPVGAGLGICSFVLAALVSALISKAFEEV